MTARYLPVRLKTTTDKIEDDIMFENPDVVDSIGGVATSNGLKSSGGKVQVVCKNITGTGTGTVTGRVGDDKEFTPISNGTINLSSPQGLIIEGRFSQIRVASDSDSDVFQLEVRS